MYCMDGQCGTAMNADSWLPDVSLVTKDYGRDSETPQNVSLVQVIYACPLATVQIHPNASLTANTLFETRFTRIALCLSIASLVLARER